MLALLKGIYHIFRCLREFVISLFFILFVLICFSLVSTFTSETSLPPFEKGALTLNLDGYLADNRDESIGFRRLLQSELGGKDDPIKISTFDVVNAINTAQYDDRITGLVLDLSYFEGGDLPSLTFIAKAIEQFKTAQKPVIAIGEHYSQQQYYLASFADKIYLNQAGFISLQGLSYSNLYFKSLLDKIEAVPHIFRVGTYKSAVEPFIRNDMSPQARENAQAWLSRLWLNFRQDIAKNRQISTASVLPQASEYIRLFREAQGDEARYALNQQLVSEVLTRQQMEAKLLEQFGKDHEGNYRRIDFFDYLDQLNDRFNVKAEHKIAVVNVEGEIVWGESDEDSAGSDTIVHLLRQAQRDPQVHGVVLRINSPGGSAMASELIRQAVEDLQSAGKPVVASMGGLAASGGYWIAAKSDKIIASPNTITGSIGIFGLSVDFEKTAQNLGIRQDGVTTSPFASNSLIKPLSPEQSEVIQISIEHGYDRFLTLVSEGRKMSKAAVDKVAQGQIWLGEAALEKGLVDSLGDFDTAYATLTELINQQRQTENQPPIQQFKAQWLVEQSDDFFSQLKRDLKLKLQLAELLPLPLDAQQKLQLGTLTRFNDPKQSYLYCLNCGVVK